MQRHDCTTAYNLREPCMPPTPRTSHDHSPLNPSRPRRRVFPLHGTRRLVPTAELEPRRLRVRARGGRRDGGGGCGGERRRRAGQAARRGDPVPAAGPRDPGGAPRAAARGAGLRRHLRQHGVRAPPDGARAGRRSRRPRRRQGPRHLRRRGGGDAAAGPAVRAGERRLPRGVRPLAAPRPVHGGRAARPPRARRGASPPRRRRPGHHLPRRRHLLRLAGDAGRQARRAVRVVLDGAGAHLHLVLPHGPPHQARPLQMQRASEGHDHVHPRRAGHRAAGAHVVPAADGRHLRGPPHHLQGVRGGSPRRLRPLQHRGGAGAVHHRRPPRREALLRRRPHPPRRLRSQRRRDVHVGGVRLLAVARRAARRLRALRLLRQLRAPHPAGAARDRRRRAGQRRAVSVGAAAGRRQLRRPGPAPGGLRCGGGGGGSRRRRAVVLPGGGPRPPRRRRLPHALRLEFHPGERVGGRAHALLPAAHRPVHQPAARRAGVARRRVRRRPRRGGRRRGEREDPRAHARGGGGRAPAAGARGEEHARGRHGARRLVAAGLRRARRRADATLRRRSRPIPSLTRREFARNARAQFVMYHYRYVPVYSALYWRRRRRPLVLVQTNALYHARVFVYCVHSVLCTSIVFV